MRHLALLVPLAVACSSSAKKSPAPPPLQNQAPQDAPASAPVSLDDDGILDALNAQAKEEHFIEVMSLEHVAFHTRAKRKVRAFHLYAYSSFDAWRGELAKEGKLDDLTRELEEAREKCQEEHEAEVAEAEVEVERLRKIAEASGDPDDRDQVDEAEATVVGLGEDGPSCPDWSDHFPGADLAAACDPDVGVLAAYDVSRDEAGKIELFSVGRETLSMCGLASADFAGTLVVQDFDQDGAPEVLLAWQGTKTYDEFGRGDQEPIPDDVTVTVFRADATAQGDWTSKITPDPDDDQDVSGRLQSWFADEDGDGHKDFVYRQTVFRPGCTCDDATFTEGGKIAAWQERYADEWTLLQEHCIDESSECTMDSDYEVVQLYDRAKDEWRARR